MTERPTQFDRGQDKRPKVSPLEDLIDLDGKLLSMLSRRGKIVQRAAKGRQVLDRELEKALWAAFELASRSQGLDPRLARQLFALMNSFGLEAADARRSADKPFSMVPRSEAADIDILFVDMATYATSSTFGIICREINVPIVLIAIQPLAAMDYPKGTTFMQLCNDDFCSVTEFTGVAIRFGRRPPPFILGFEKKSRPCF